MASIHRLLFVLLSFLTCATALDLSVLQGSVAQIRRWLPRNASQLVPDFTAHVPHWNLTQHLNLNLTIPSWNLPQWNLSQRLDLSQLSFTPITVSLPTTFELPAIIFPNLNETYTHWNLSSFGLPSMVAMTKLPNVHDLRAIAPPVEWSLAKTYLQSAIRDSTAAAQVFRSRLCKAVKKAQRELEENDGQRAQGLSRYDVYAETRLFFGSAWGIRSILPFEGYPTPGGLNSDLRRRLNARILAHARTSRRSLYLAKRREFKAWVAIAQQQVLDAMLETQYKFIDQPEACFTYQADHVQDVLEKEWQTPVGNLIALSGPMRIVLETVVHDVMTSVRHIHAEAELKAHIVRLEARGPFHEQVDDITLVYDKASQDIIAVFTEAVDGLEPPVWQKAYWHERFLDARKYAVERIASLQKTLSLGCECSL
ncbi:hypothetical protein BCR43DRAFT_485295 [Syncephalastrum racemosum]|uniref:Uncharacterized protein n=1 Tax=Syncephalastrum racemosum TaxID=13706 RepID=A0A1X2HM48_SYNRA|nr:hypothetical protein BCR43DRAFT_485295 [Syncephalastrum racemosum]